jgi:general secretion pathway protein L
MKEKSSQRLLVFLPPRRSHAGRAPLGSGTVVGYVGVGGRDIVRGESPIALLPKAEAVDLVLDASDVFITAIEPPRLAEGKLRLALPNMLEDRLLADAADCHFAYKLARGGSGTTTIAAQPKMPVAVVDRGLLTRALDALTESGYRVRAAYSEIYTVPAPAAGVLSVRIDKRRGVARSATHDGFVFELGEDDTPPATLALAVRQLGIKRIHAFGADGAAVSHLSAALQVQVDVSKQEVDLASTDGAVNLLQGAFAQSGMLGQVFGGARLAALSSGALRVPLMWAAAAVVVAIGGMNAYYLKLDAEARAIRAQMEASFRSAFPGEAISDSIIQTRRHLADLRARAGIPSPNDFSVLNARTAILMTLAPVGSVTAMEYRDGGLRVRFKPGIADNPGLQNTLRAAAIQQGLAIRFESDVARITAAGS